MAQRYTTIHRCMSQTLMHPLLRDVTTEQYVMLAADFLRIVGCPAIYEDKTATIRIDNHRAPLPCDLMKLTQMRSLRRHKMYRATTDTFHVSNRNERLLPDEDLTYKIQRDVIITNVENDEAEIAYRALETDQHGYPLIPDEPKLIRALDLYVKLHVFTMLFDCGKINQNVLANTQSDYAFAVGAAQNEMVKPTLDEMEAFSRSWNTLIPRVSEHDTSFRFNGAQERIIQH